MEKKKFSSQFKSRSFRTGGFNLILSCVVVVVVIVLNIIISELPSTMIKYDFTANNYYTISDNTKEIVKNINEDVTIYFLDSTKTSSSAQTNEILEFVQRYESINDHIKVERVDPVLNPDFYTAYTDTAPSECSLIVVSEKRSKVVDYKTILQTEKTINYETYQYETTTYFNGEQSVTSAIDYVTTEILPVIYYIEGHGELEISDKISNSITDDNIYLKALSLLETENGIPDDASAVFIYCPTIDYSEDEITMLQTYINNGGNVILITEHTCGTLTNLFSFTADRGLSYEEGLLFEQSASKYYQYPFYLIPTMSSTEISSLLTTDNITLLLPAAHGITQSDAENVTVTPLLKTSETAYIKKNSSSMTTYEKEDGDKQGVFFLGALSTDSTSDGKLIWYSTPYISEQVYNNFDYFLASVNYLCEKDSSVVIAAGKSTALTALAVPTSSANLWMVVLCIVVPVVTLGIGLVIWTKRRKR